MTCICKRPKDIRLCPNCSYDCATIEVLAGLDEPRHTYGPLCSKCSKSVYNRSIKHNIKIMKRKLRRSIMWIVTMCTIVWYSFIVLLEEMWNRKYITVISFMLIFSVIQFVRLLFSKAREMM